MMATIVAVNKNTKSARFISFSLLLVIVTHLTSIYRLCFSPFRSSLERGHWCLYCHFKSEHHPDTHSRQSPSHRKDSKPNQAFRSRICGNSAPSSSTLEWAWCASRNCRICRHRGKPWSFSLLLVIVTHLTPIYRLCFSPFRSSLDNRQSCPLLSGLRVQVRKSNDK